MDEPLARRAPGMARRRPVRVLNVTRLHVEGRDAFLRAAPPFIAATRAEPGCLSYDLMVSVTDPLTVTAMARWADRQAVRAHLAAPHTRNFLAMVAAASSQPPSMTLLDDASEEALG